MIGTGFSYPLAIQTLLPEAYREIDFRKRLDLLQDLGFTGIELNIVRPEQVDPVDLKGMLAEHGLRMTMFASGATAKAEGLSLSHENDAARMASIQRCKGLIDYAAAYDAGIIAGFLKGGTTVDQEGARARFRDSIGQVEAHIRTRKVPFLIEATNRYESVVANSLQDAADLIEGFDNPFLRILPDTFHMNIEERSVEGALIKHKHLYDSLHISDSNRFFPGLGALDFFAFLRFLKDAGYKGGIAIEGNLQSSFEEDLGVSMEILKPVLCRE